MARYFYSISVIGVGGITGIGVVVLDDSGLVVGADNGGVEDDGHFELHQGQIKTNVLVSIPAGVRLVTRSPSTHPYQFNVNLSFPLDDMTSEQKVDTPAGQVRFRLKKLRAAP